ncbi:MAG: hypothetical protein WCK90_03140, partial [archaeon]
MEIRVNITKTRFFLIVLSVFIVASAFFVLATVSNWDATKKTWHSSSDVKVTVGGQDYSLQDAISNNLIGGSNYNYVKNVTFINLGFSCNGCSSQDAENCANGHPITSCPVGTQYVTLI